MKKKRSKITQFSRKKKTVAVNGSSVIEFLHNQEKFLTDCKRLGTALNYRRVAHSLALFLGGKNLYFTEMTSQFIEQYGDYLMQKGLVRNSLSFHMRILRAVYNKAVRCGYAKQSFPFRNIYTGIDHTRKRAVSRDVITRLIHLDIVGNSSLCFARDLFLFSFYTRGMAFVDMAYLQKTDIQNDIICYNRHKTGQQLSIKVEPCIKNIIDRYLIKNRYTRYVFPIINSEEPEVSFRQYKSELRIYNYRLKTISQMLGLEYNLSSYTPRHSWATMAQNNNVPVSVISASMGHTSERTTRIYLASFDNAVIDKANRGILESITKSLSKCSL